MSDTENRGELKPGERHPSSNAAWDIIWAHSRTDIHNAMEAFSSCAIEGNRLAEVCAETLRRLLSAEPVSDRHIMGLALTLQKVKPPKTYTDTLEEFQDKCQEHIEALRKLVKRSVQQTGLKEEDCQQCTLINNLNHLEYAVRGTTKEDLINATTTTED